MAASNAAVNAGQTVGLMDVFYFFYFFFKNEFANEFLIFLYFGIMFSTEISLVSISIVFIVFD